MKTKKRISILCVILCFVMLLASCNQANPSTDTSKASDESSVNGTNESSSTQELSEESSEESSETEPDYQTEMTVEMMRAYLKFKHIDRPLEDLLAMHKGGSYDYKDDYIAFGNLNGYTLCGVLPNVIYGTGYIVWFPLSCIAGGYVIMPIGEGLMLDFCLYKDNEFISLKEAYKKGLFDGKDAYELIIKNDKYNNCAKKLSEIEYQLEMTEEMANAFLKFMGENLTIHEVMTALNYKGHDYNEYYLPFGNLNGYTFFYADGPFNSGYDAAISSYVAGDYLFQIGHIMYPSKIGLYLYKDNKFMTFEDAYEQGLFDPDDAYALMVEKGTDSVVTKLSDLPADEAEEYRKWYSPENKNNSEEP